MHAKPMVLDVLRRLPDDCTLDDVLHHLRVVREIEVGLHAARAAGAFPMSQINEELRRMWDSTPRV